MRTISVRNDMVSLSGHCTVSSQVLGKEIAKMRHMAGIGLQADDSSWLKTTDLSFVSIANLEHSGLNFQMKQFCFNGY